MKRGFKFIIYSVAVLAIILGIYFVSAAVEQVTGVIVRNNVTPVYDEGTFVVNWTAVTLATNYSVYVWTNNVLYTVAGNNTALGFSFSNTTEANYTFHISASNSTGNGANSTNVSIYVDRTAPVITLPQYTNGTVKTNTQQLILNISITDASSGLTGTLCTFEINGTNQTVAPSGSYCNTSSLDLTNLAAGNQTIKVWVNDTVNILGLNNSFVVQIDGDAPTATASCSPSTINEGDTFPCTCSGTDSSSTVTTSTSSTSGSVTDTSVIGTYTYTCTVTDSVGNSASDTETYTVLNVGGGGSSGGGGSTPQGHTFTKITPGAAAIFKDFDSEIGVKQIQIEVNNEAQNVKITVTKYDGKPAEVSVSKSGKVYQYLQINEQNLGAKLDKATVQFKVEKAWASGNGLDKEEIAVYKFDEAAGKWNKLTTTFSSEDSNYYYYDAEVNSFSYFAIAEAAATAPEATGAAGTTEEGRSLTWLWILIALVIVIVVWLMMRKK